jgi:sterol desaturase/sphingolipid hydroxylase (fatty acid hydroxylase superfamily)
MKYFGFFLNMKTTQAELPPFSIHCLQMLFCMLCEDINFYFSHRLLHHPKLYPYIHKIHHEFYNTICIASEYAHPLEFVLGNLGPVSLGALILGPNIHVIT